MKLINMIRIAVYEMSLQKTKSLLSVMVLGICFCFVRYTKTLSDFDPWGALPWLGVSLSLFVVVGMMRSERKRMELYYDCGFSAGYVFGVFLCLIAIKIWLSLGLAVFLR